MLHEYLDEFPDYYETILIIMELIDRFCGYGYQGFWIKLIMTSEVGEDLA